MITYAFWNNKGGTGKTSLAFQAITEFAAANPSKKILAIDLCPQANLSELLLGGLLGQGSANLFTLHSAPTRRTIGGYFEKRLPSPFKSPVVNVKDYLCQPSTFNAAIPPNLDLIAGDPIVELQSNPVATLSNTQIPGTDTWLAVTDWLRDLLDTTDGTYDFAFLDSNPSFSVYTQIGLAAADRLVLPVMADDSSRRALQNAMSLVFGVQLPSQIYNQYAFSTKLTAAGRSLPKIHLILKNRLTQYMGPASAYSSVLRSIDNDLTALLKSHPQLFTFSQLKDGLAEIRDFQTTGVVAFAEARPFSRVKTGLHDILGRETQIASEYLENCRSAINGIVKKL